MFIKWTQKETKTRNDKTAKTGNHRNDKTAKRGFGMSKGDKKGYDLGVVPRVQSGGGHLDSPFQKEVHYLPHYRDTSR